MARFGQGIGEKELRFFYLIICNLLSNVELERGEGIREEWQKPLKRKP